MDAIEKRAREIFAEWHADKGCSARVVRDCLSGKIQMDALTSELLRLALTLPDGWVLMPMETTARMLDDAYAAFPGFAGEDQIDAVYAALIAARPEVPRA